MTCRGPERVLLLKRWLLVLNEVEKLSASAALSEDKQKTLEQHLYPDDGKESPRKQPMVSEYIFFLFFLCMLFLGMLSTRFGYC